VGRKEFAVDEPDLTILEQRGADEKTVIGRFLHERNHGGNAIGL